MFNRKTTYSLNKKDSTAIIYLDANNTVIRLTPTDFGSVKEFRKWKNWYNMKEHHEEKKEHIHKNHTVSLDDTRLSLLGCSLLEDQSDENMQKEIMAIRKAGLRYCIKHVLSAKQFRRMWMYYVEDLNSYRIAEIEGTSHQAILKSINAGKKKVLRFFNEGLLNSLKIGD